MESFVEWILKIVFLILAVCIESLFLMALWNFCIPDIFSLPAISYPQALGLCGVCSVLFQNISFKE